MQAHLNLTSVSFMCISHCQKFSFRSCFRWQLLASSQNRQQTLHTCYFRQAASAGVQSTAPAHSECAYAS